MRTMLCLASAVILALGPSHPASGAEPSEPQCQAGVYQLADGTIVDVAPAGDTLRWRTLEGRTGRLSRGVAGQWVSTLGWTSDPDGILVSFGPCGMGAIQFDNRYGQRVPLHVVETRFRSGAETLAGRLVLPQGLRKVPVMVVGHGSERNSALENAFRQRLYPAAGVGVFVFDKRGTGQSTGKYTQDFEVLAGDAAAAMAEARRLAVRRGRRFGFQGGSQAGWVLPLAAQKVAADFVIIGYGIAASPLIEDRTETLQDLAAAGWGEDVLQKAIEVTEATGRVVASDFTGGYGQLRAVVAKYGKESWFKDLKGEFTGEVVKYPESVLRVEGPKRDEGTTWEFDAVSSLRRLRAPLLWMVAADDSEGPGEETRRNLAALRTAGRPVTIAVFPQTEHGIHTYRRDIAGKREETGYAPDYFRLELEFARTGRLGDRYGSADVMQPLRR